MMPDVPMWERHLPTVTVDGEEFAVEKAHGKVYISHPWWSLTGMGNNLARAIFDMRVSARILYESYRDVSATNMTLAALRMRGYMYKAMVADYTDENGNCMCSMCRHVRNA